MYSTLEDLADQKRTAVMLEDHSPTSRSSSRKPFRRKGAKTVIFNNSCTYYQLESLSYDTSDAEGEEVTEDLIAEDQADESDQEASEVEIHPPEEKVETKQRRQDDLTEIDTLIDNEIDVPHPSPRIGMDTVDYSGSFPLVFEGILIRSSRSWRSQGYAYQRLE